MKQKVKTLKKQGDHHLPDEIYIDSDLSAGQELHLQYYLHRKASPHKGYISAFDPDDQAAVGRFIVRELYANMLTAPPCIMVELEAQDPRYFLRYPVERILLLSEQEVIEKLQVCTASE